MPASAWTNKFNLHIKVSETAQCSCVYYMSMDVDGVTKYYEISRQMFVDLVSLKSVSGTIKQ